MSSTPSSTEISTAAGILQAALDSGVDLAIHFGGWTRLQRRALAMALGASEAAYADAKAAAAAPAVKKAPARPPVDVAPAKAASPAPSTVTQPASEPMGHLDSTAGGQSAVFGKSPPPATWREVGFQTREHAEAAAAMNYVSALAFYAAMGRGELQVGPQQAASSSGDQAGPLDGYLAEADAKAAEDRRMREIQERIAGEIRQDEADREAASGSGSRPAQPRARFPQPATTPAPVQARYPNANASGRSHRDGELLEVAVDDRLRGLSAGSLHRADVGEMEADGLVFHEAVTSGRLRLPCATTPAEDDQERPAPKRVRQKLPEPAKARWAADGRRFAPWHYVEEAMMHDSAGRLRIIPPRPRRSCTCCPPATRRPISSTTGPGTRANGWHWGVARRLLAMLVVLTAAGPVQAAPAPEPRRSTMQWMVEQFGGGPVPMEPPPRLRPDLELPDDDPDMQLWTHWRHEVTRLRREVLVELAQLVQDMRETTDEWLAARSAPVRSTYTVPGKTRHTQIPVVLHLLQMVGYPDVAGMTSDLTDGFDMLGEVGRGPGWKPRTDGRYSNP
ncbi:eIF3-S7, partial [Symbiodinium necroappetens]